MKQANVYKLFLDENDMNVLVKEKSIEYKSDISEPKAIVDLLNKNFCLDRMAEEYVYLLCMNVKGKILGVFEISHGNVESSICNPREVLIRCILCGAAGVMIVHNHPSGQSCASKADIKLHERFEEVFDIMGIRYNDFIIIGNQEYTSFNELAMM